MPYKRSKKELETKHRAQRAPKKSPKTPGPLTDIQTQAHTIFETSEQQEHGDSNTFRQAFGHDFGEKRQPPFFDPIDLTASQMESLGKACLQWAKTEPEALKIRQFFLELEMDFEDIARMSRKSPLFKRYYLMAKDVIGNRREIAGLQGQLDAGLVRNSMRMFDPDWATVEQDRVREKTIAEGRSEGNIIVKMDMIPDCPEVPHRLEPAKSVLALDNVSESTGSEKESVGE